MRRLVKRAQISSKVKYPKNKKRGTSATTSTYIPRMQRRSESVLRGCAMFPYLDEKQVSIAYQIPNSLKTKRFGESLATNRKVQECASPTKSPCIPKPPEDQYSIFKNGTIYSGKKWLNPFTILIGSATKPAPLGIKAMAESKNRRLGGFRHSRDLVL